MKIGLKLWETGYRFASIERVRVYLTNSLEPPSDENQQLTLAGWAPALAHEAHAVNAVKRHQRFTVVIGNPPYAGHSSNSGPWIERLVDDYFQVDGQPLKEANSKWLRDDYVKFVRVGQQLLRTAGQGVLSFITNHGYIDNPTFRGMRLSLLKDFSHLWVTDLHGNMKKRERTIEGEPDHNVFDIQQGVGILLALRGAPCPGTVRHAHIRGKRNDKYGILQSSVAQRLATHLVQAAPPFYLLAPQDEGAREEYEKFTSLTSDPVASSLGILTKRDALVVAFTRDEVAENLRRFGDRSISDVAIAQEFGLPLRDKDKWNIAEARSSAGRADPNKIRRLLYRPFDFRYLYYDEVLVARMNRRVLQHLESNRANRGLILGRQGMATGSEAWDVCYVCSEFPDQNVYRRGGGTVFPLRLGTHDGRLVLEDSSVNLPPSVLTLLRVFDTTPDHIFHYIYAVFHSPTYRTRYAEFLKIDFPRLPLTSSLELFRDLARLGGELVALHLVEAPAQQALSARYDTAARAWRYEVAQGQRLPVALSFTGPESPVVAKVAWSDDTVWIDALKPKKGAADATVTSTVGFRGVPQVVWSFHIGGYQVCAKWLKDRKGRVLSPDDIAHYHRIVIALHETIRLMAEIDLVIAAHGGWPIK